jgi:hypothetical protein
LRTKKKSKLMVESALLRLCPQQETQPQQHSLL